MKNKAVFIQSLGCPKNLVDSEVMAGLLRDAGFKVVDDPGKAQICIINTCGFIQPAVEEGLDAILCMTELKKRQKDIKLVVTGCMVQRYQNDLMVELPEVDYFIGSDGFQDIVKIVERIGVGAPNKGELRPPLYLMDANISRAVSTPAHRAYLKITEGCSNTCSYCIIPKLRGRLRSRDIDDIVAEAKVLEASGVKELTLVGQDVTAYGIDLGKKVNLSQLLQKLTSNTRIPWLRMLYMYPNRITDELLATIAQESRIIPYFDIPLQHASAKVLEQMNRPREISHIEELLDKIRSKLPDATLRTTFIVGFPGEAEDDFLVLEDFIVRQRFDHLGIFAFCREEGTAAAELPGQLDQEIKEMRRERLMAIQKVISNEINQKLISQKIEVLVEGLSSETNLLLEGRTRFQAPEIDGCVFINEGKCNAGDLVTVEIVAAHSYDLVGRIV